MLKIALPNKGRLVEDVKDLFSDAGLPLRMASDRALVARLSDDYEAIFARAQDIPEFVADGAADVGITGYDLVVESGRAVESQLDLGFGRCRLVAAVRDDSHIKTVADVASGARVASCFPRQTEAFFSQLGKKIALVPMSGAVEVAPHLGIADLIVDLVSTGSTLRTNGLREIAVVAQSTARLIARRDIAPTPALKELVVALESVVRARDKRYLMANCPRATLDKVRACLPGINGPTVSDIMDNDDYVAIHAVVAADRLFRTISDLSTLGCRGILVTRIERLSP